MIKYVGTSGRLSGDRFLNQNDFSLQEEVDAGAIITQEAVPVLNGDTVETLQERVKCAEHRAYPRAMELLTSGRIKLNDDNKVQWMW